MYDFKVSAVNAIGDESDLSNSVTIAMANQALQPPQPTVDRAKSSLTSVFIEWQEGAQGDIRVLGYELFMIELATGEVTRVYNGANNEDVK